MPAVKVSIDWTPFAGLETAMRGARRHMLSELALAFNEIGRIDIASLQTDLTTRLKIKRAGLRKSFKFKATDQDHASDFKKLFVSEYTGWKAAEIFQTGGDINAKNVAGMTVLFNLSKSGGFRSIAVAQLRMMFASGAAKIIHTPKGSFIIDISGSFARKKSESPDGNGQIIGMLLKRVSEKKRLDFFENSQGNDSKHMEVLGMAVDNTLAAIASGTELKN